MKAHLTVLLISYENMRIIVVGAGKVGSALCRSLVAEKHDVTLIEADEQVLKQVTRRQDIMGIVGNGANFKILEQADIKTCDIFVALTEKDEVNMIAAVLAKKMGATETIVRVRNPEYSNIYFKAKNFLDFSLIVNPEMLAARSIANIVEFPNAQSVEHFASGRVMLMEFKITADSKLCHIQLSQFRKKFGNILVCAIERDHDIIIPDGDATLQAGDTIFVTGSRVEMILFHSHVKSNTIRNLMLVGAGKIAYYLLNIFEASKTKISVKMIEVNEERARWFSEEFPHIHIVKGDGTAKSVLLEEGVTNFDAVATLTPIDEENILTSMSLDKIGIRKNITKVNRTSLLDIIDRKEFASIVTPKRIAVDSIMHFIRGRKNAQEASTLDAMHHIGDGRIETLQFEIHQGSPMVGINLMALNLKKNVLIAAIIRKGKPIYPTGEDSLQVGDKIVVFTLLQNVTNVRDLLAR
ncbi:Trk system potassium transporter TrkA [Streptococcus plurextorum]|uniref:Trk system potassium transporter TrkA n=1 Tax=Streptococcus plurextorum TaxID=456876 RepID=UPI000A012662|nr:Trk system potassium transporter TrkA [Streptococcus plurextorum]